MKVLLDSCIWGPAGEAVREAGHDGASHRGIFRLVGFSARDQGRVIVDVLDRYGRELSEGGLVTVEPGRARIRPADR